jgi:tRNA A-37 threonylcarbamoyl transferase component Bud32
MRLQLANPADHPRISELPFAESLEDWDLPQIHGVLGIHRHVVRRVMLGPNAYVVKELPDDLAQREYRLLRELAEDGLPTAEVVAVVTGRTDQRDGVLITRHLDYSLPFRSLLSGNHVAAGRGEHLLDALVGLLVRLHLEGFYWGDCSLSNTLFRRDAGALSAYVIDVETGERHHRLTDGQRTLDLDIAMENVAGGLLDLQAAGHLSDDIDPADIALALEERYHSLWTELTRTDEFEPHESFRIEQRLDRLHELGFDVDEMEIVTTADGQQLRIVPRVVEHGYHTHRLHDLTGLVTQENQARRLLNDIRSFASDHLERTGDTLGDTTAADRWLRERFEAVIDAIPTELVSKLEDAELYHQFLEHRWFISEAAGHDVPLDEAVASFIVNVLASAPHEQVHIPEPTTEVPVIETGDDLAPDTDPPAH